MRLSLAALSLVLAIATLPACAVNESSQRERELTEMLEALTPANAQRERLVFGGCVALQSDPDCARMNLMWPEVSFEERSQKLESLALGAGWAKTGETVRSGGTTINFLREGYLLWIDVTPPEVLVKCPPLSGLPVTQASTCFDLVAIDVIE